MSILKKLIKYVFSLLNIFLYRSIKREELISFIKLFKIQIPSNINLIRIGSNHDGGYLVPDILDQIDICFSAGIGDNIQFEKNLSKYNIKSFGIDHTIQDLPEKVTNYSFLRKKISSFNDNNNITFERWVKNQNIIDDNLICQIDIEGDEYNLVLDTSNEVFKKFKVLVIEFHNLHKINDEIVYNFYINVFKKILENFNICHIHVNNAENQTKIRGIKVPHLLEITYLRKDFYKSDFKEVKIPNNLDRKNVLNNDDVNFDKNWIDIITKN